MKTFIVFVTFKAPGVSGSFTPTRYIDSQWADIQHAKDRRGELEGSLKMGNAPGFMVEIIEGRIADAAIQSLIAPQEPNPGTQGGQS